MWIRTYRFSCIVLVLVVIQALYWSCRWIYWHRGYESAGYLTDQVNLTGLQTILLLTPMDGSYANWDREFPSSYLNCHVHSCKVTSDHNNLPQAKAVVVSISDINRWIWTWLPRQSSSARADQLWAAIWGEAPDFFFKRTTFDTSLSLSTLNEIFNWTISYRHDADFDGSYSHSSWRDYCSWQPITDTAAITNNSQHQTNLEILSMKSELALWIVSDCKTLSRREDYVKQMEEHIPITMLGSCGHLGRDKNAFQNMNFHKFYLSFENSLCDDYITEKFFNVIYRYNTVPVVMGPRKKDYLRFAPPYSFIHIEDFKGPKDLAMYLKFLDKNPEEYLKYLAWKPFYKLHCQQSWACAMCEALYSNTNKTIISDFRQFWEKSTCYANWNYTLKSNAK